MHYYKRSIGDYHRKAGRLNMLQHGAYTLLMDACYDREQFPTHDEAMEWTWASTTEEIEATTFVLKRFFFLDDGVYKQKRIVEIIEQYQGNCETNKRIAIERETKRKKKSTKREQGVDGSGEKGNEPPPNQEPRTTNQEPKDKPKRKTHAHFDAFWSVYPNKKDKKKSRALWGNRNLDSMAESIIADVENRVANDDQWKKGFIPMPTTYINGDRWDDSVGNAEHGKTGMWHETSTGIEAKAKELGIVLGEREPWPNFKIRVYEAAGFKPDGKE